jgi:hypothetical protein
MTTTTSTFVAVLTDVGELCQVRLLTGAVHDPKARLGEGFNARLAPGDGPLVVLFGEDGTDETDDGGSVGAGRCRPTSVRRRISLSSRSWGLFDQI